jgi:Uma2 family endonuclease
MVQLDHEKLEFWLKVVLHLFVQRRNLGIVLGSRTAVQINEFRGRLPDLFFVRRERMEIVQQKGVYGSPDLVIEIISPGDRASTVRSLEADYRTVGVEEIVFIDQKRRKVRFLRKQASGYTEEQIAGGTVLLETLGGLQLQWEWLFDEPRPDELTVVGELLAVPPGAAPSSP